MLEKGWVWDGRNMWVKHDWTQMNNAEIYGSNWTWTA